MLEQTIEDLGLFRRRLSKKWFHGSALRTRALNKVAKALVESAPFVADFGSAKRGQSLLTLLIVLNTAGTSHFLLVGDQAARGSGGEESKRCSRAVRASPLTSSILSTGRALLKNCHEKVAPGHLLWLRGPEQKKKRGCDIGQDSVFTAKLCCIFGDVNEMHKIAGVRGVW